MRSVFQIEARRRRYLCLLGVVGLCLFFGRPLLLKFNHVTGVWLNTTASLPFGFYRESTEGLGRGVLVAFCLGGELAKFGIERGYLIPMQGRCENGTQPLLKEVAAVEGDAVEVGSGGVAVNGTLIPATVPLLLDSKDRPLRAVTGMHRVGAGEIWVISNYIPGSWDSRYFGPVSTRDVFSVMEPLWVLQ